MFAITNKGKLSSSDFDAPSIARPGDIAFYDYFRSFDFSIDGDDVSVGDGTAHTGIETINITIPRDVLTHAIGSAPRGAGFTIGADQPIDLIIENFFGGLIANGRLLDTAMAARMAGIGLDLQAAGLAKRLALEPKRSAGAVSLIYRAETFIESSSGTTI